MERAVKTSRRMNWTYETDEMDGVCVIAMDAMKIKFKFQAFANEFFDVLKINEAISEQLKQPVSVEGITDFLSAQFPGMVVTVSGRAASHGWITARA